MLYEQLPSSVVWHLEDVFNLNVIRTTLFCRLLTRLGYLQNLFLIERLLTKDGHANKQDLIDVAKEMLDLTLLIFKHHDRFAGFHGDYEWLVGISIFSERRRRSLADRLSTMQHP